MKILSALLCLVLLSGCYALQRPPETVSKPVVYVSPGVDLPEYQFAPGPDGSACLTPHDFAAYQVERDLLFARIHYLVSILRDMGAIFTAPTETPKK